MSFSKKPEQGIFGRILKRPHKAGIAYDLEKMLPDLDALPTLSEIDIDNFLTKNKNSTLQTIGYLIDLHIVKLIKTAGAEDFIKRKIDNIINFGTRLGGNTELLHQEKIRAAKYIFSDLYKNKVLEKENDEKEREQILIFGSSLGLSDNDLASELNKLLEPILQQALTTILEDSLISPDEEKHLHSLADEFKINLSFDPETQKIINLAKNRWRLYNGELPIVDCPLMLKKGEICHAATTAKLYEQRSQTIRRSYSGPSVRIKIVKGLYYNAGSYSTGAQTETYMKFVGRGNLVLTNKRILFSSAEKSISFSLDSIVDWVLYSDGVEFRRATGKPPTFVFSDSPGLFLETLIAARGQMIG